MEPKRPGLLVILDGFAWGDSDHPCNAVALAKTPTFDKLRATRPVASLANNGKDVGLPPGQMGNSEVGHMNIGAGRVVLQDFMRINDSIARGTYGTEPALAKAFAAKRLHLMGLLGPGGIHAHESHFAAALKAARGKVFVHPVADGRDTPPRSAAAYLATLQQQIDESGNGRIASLTGRYYAMDRDQRWERIQAAYDLYTDAGFSGHQAKDAHAALEAAYARGEGDEFIEPTRIRGEGVIRDGDAVLWLNFRPDRSRQITRAFQDPDFQGFTRKQRPRVEWVCTTTYDASFAEFPRTSVAFPPVHVPMTLAEHIGHLGLSQFHLAETEKYAHVTYFLNGGQERAFPGEERHMVPSPNVKTYDLKPEMSAHEVTDRLLLALGSGGHDLIVVNYANPDMVGHTGDLEATIKAVEVIDGCMDRVVTVADEMGFVTLITADHGNAEEMCRLENGEPGEPVTKHSMNPSPLLLSGMEGITLADGALCDVAPTLLDLMGLPQPTEMTGKCLVR